MKLNKEQRRAEYEGYNAYIAFMTKRTDEAMEEAYKAFANYCEILNGYKAVKFDFTAILCGHMNNNRKEELYVKTYRAYRTVCERMEQLHTAKVNYKDMNAPKEKGASGRKQSKTAQRDAELAFVQQQLNNGDISVDAAKDKELAIYKKYAA